MSISRLLGSLFLLALGSTTLRAQIPRNWTDSIAPFRLIDNVYYVGSAGLGAYLITTPAGHILLDVGLPANAPMVERSITALGFALRDVKIILNTHAHHDHAGGIAQLKRSTGARLLASAGDRGALEGGVYVGSEEDVSLRFPPVTVDSTIADRQPITMGGVTLTAHITPGHSRGCTTWTMPVTSDGARHTAVFFCSASVAANRIGPRNPQYPGIVADYRRTFAHLQQLDADVFLAPHAEFFNLQAKRVRLGGGGLNPFIDPGALQRIAARMKADFEKELVRQASKD